VKPGVALSQEVMISAAARQAVAADPGFIAAEVGAPSRGAVVEAAAELGPV
jgi:hypothetical protein